MTTVLADMVTIGKIERPFGVKGACKVRPLSDVPGRFDHLGTVCIVASTGQVAERVVTHVRQAGSSYIMQFAGITCPEQAGALRGGFIQVPRREPSPHAGDVLYECDLIGMTVVDENGHYLGSIETIWEMPGHRVFVVRHEGRELLIPAVKHFVSSVDVVQHRMTVREIDGLIEDPHAL